MPGPCSALLRTLCSVSTRFCRRSSATVQRQRVSPRQRIRPRREREYRPTVLMSSRSVLPSLNLLSLRTYRFRASLHTTTREIIERVPDADSRSRGQCLLFVFRDGRKTSRRIEGEGSFRRKSRPVSSQSIPRWGCWKLRFQSRALQLKTKTAKPI